MKDYSKENIKKALERAMKSEQLKKLYEEAPAEAKEYYRLKFWLMMFDDDGEVDADEYKAEREKVLEKFSVEDWEYLRDNMPPNNPFWRRCDKAVKELKNA